MTRHGVIDPVTNRLTAPALYRVYVYCCREAEGKRGYYPVRLGVLAYHVGLPYAFVDSDNAEAKRLLHDGLRRVERLGYIKVRPRDGNSVNVLLRVSYSKAKRNRNPRTMWRLFQWEPSEDRRG